MHLGQAGIYRGAISVNCLSLAEKQPKETVNFKEVLQEKNALAFVLFLSSVLPILFY